MLERSEHDGLVLDGVDDVTLAGRDEAGADVVDGRDGDDEAVFAGARPLDLREELLLHGVHELRPEVARRQHDLVVQANVEEHVDSGLGEGSGTAVLEWTNVLVSLLIWWWLREIADCRVKDVYKRSRFFFKLKTDLCHLFRKHSKTKTSRPRTQLRKTT